MGNSNKVTLEFRREAVRPAGKRPTARPAAKPAQGSPMTLLPQNRQPAREQGRIARDPQTRPANPQAPHQPSAQERGPSIEARSHRRCGPSARKR